MLLKVLSGVLSECGIDGSMYTVDFSFTKQVDFTHFKVGERVVLRYCFKGIFACETMRMGIVLGTIKSFYSGMIGAEIDAGEYNALFPGNLYYTHINQYAAAVEVGKIK